MSTVRKLIKDDEKEWPSENKEAFFESLFHTYYKTLCRFSFRIVHDKEKAEDVVQSCFINFWQKRDVLTLHASFKSYLFRAVYNRSINEYNQSKKNRHEELSVLEEESSSRSDDPLLQLQAVELEQKIAQAIGSMPEGCRTIFLLSREEQLSYKEIAEMLEISIKTVENQMGKALRIMREHLFTACMLVFLYEIITQILFIG